MNRQTRRQTLAIKDATDEWVFRKMTSEWGSRILFITTNFTGGFNTGTYRHKGFLGNDVDSDINRQKLVKRFFRILEGACFKRKNTSKIRRKNRIRRYIATHRHTAKIHCHILMDTPIHLSEIRFHFYVLGSLREANLIQDFTVFDKRRLTWGVRKAVTYLNMHKSTGFCGYQIEPWNGNKRLVSYCNKEMEGDGHTGTIDWANSYL